MPARLPLFSQQFLIFCLNKAFDITFAIFEVIEVDVFLLKHAPKSNDAYKELRNKLCLSAPIGYQAFTISCCLFLLLSHEEKFLTV